MNKTYVLSESNYKEVIERLQKISNKWKFLRKSECFKTSVHTKKEKYPEYLKRFERKSYGTERVYDGEENGIIKIRLEKYSYSTFIGIQQHSFRKTYEENPESREGEMWLNCKPLLHINLGASQACCPTIGDKVIFKKYGFIIVTDDSYVSGGIPTAVYKDHFIIDRENKILDLEKEIEVRDKEWEDDAAEYNRQYESELMEEWYEDETEDDEWYPDLGCE